MDINAFKEAARRLEAREAWEEALDLYQGAIAELEAEGKNEHSLHSRVGDIKVRLKQPGAAGESYERAIDLCLMESNLDAAFAVCQRIMRNLPDRDDVYLRMARIRAMQSYPEYARQHFLTYAQLTGDRGDRAEAMRALEELVGLVPGDLDTRLFVVERLTSEGRTEDATVHLKEGYRRAFSARDHKRLNRLRPLIQPLDPDAVLADLPDPKLERTHDGEPPGSFGVGRRGKDKPASWTSKIKSALGLGTDEERATT
jgi:tetratricopeptide (TPR) repeat protein